jgi:dihydrofolate reductase
MESVNVRKIAAGLFVSLDGVVETPERWSMPYFNEELGQEVGAQMAAADTLLVGRITYQGFAAAFGGQSGGDADQMNSVQKVVVSTTLDKAEWQNSTLIKSNVAEEIATLKQQPGKNIGMSGSATLVRWLLRQGLLDELHLLVIPTLVGHGKRLFEDEGDPVPMRLAESKLLSNGVLHVTYVPAAA